MCAAVANTIAELANWINFTWNECIFGWAEEKRKRHIKWTMNTQTLVLMDYKCEKINRQSVEQRYNLWSLWTICKYTEINRNATFLEIYSPVKKYIHIWTRKQKNADWKERNMDEKRNMDKREREKYRLREAKYGGKISGIYREREGNRIWIEREKKQRFHKKLIFYGE